VKTRKKTKPFDCVASKRKAQSRIYRKIKGMTSQQEAAYFHRAVKNGPFAELWKELATQGRKAHGSGKLARRSA
jgi:hypothetical protein